MNFNLLSLCLILYSFIYLSNQISFKELQPFYCEDVNATTNYFKKDEIFAFFSKEDTIHFLFKDRQLAFKAPYFVETEQSDDLIFGHPYMSSVFINSFMDEYGFNGTINKNNEIYLISIKPNEKKECFKLSNNDGLMVLDSKMECKSVTANLSFDKIKKFTHYFQQNDSVFQLNYFDDKKLKIVRIFELSTRSIKELNIDYNIKAASIRNVDIHDDSRVQHLSLYEIEENFQFSISLIKTEVNTNNRIVDFKTEKKVSLNKSNFTNAIGCIDKITELNQIKGILFKDNKFYIISYRKYWIYETDLIKERFNLNNDYLSIDYLKFIGESNLANIEYEIRFSKWIKQLDNEIYFMPYKNSIFEIQDSIDHSLQLKRSDKELLNYCKGSTFRFENDDYCFGPTKYFKTKLFKDNDNQTEYQNKKYPISDLFENSPYNYTNDDKLLFIFKYDNNSIVFLTIKSILVIDIRLFIELEDYLQLKSPVDDYDFFFDENCLLRECVSVPKSSDHIFNHNHTDYKKRINREHFQITYLQSLIILSIISIILLIIVIYLVRKQINKHRNIFSYFNKRKTNYSENNQTNQSLSKINQSQDKIGQSRSKITESLGKIGQSINKIRKTLSLINKPQPTKIINSQDQIKSQSTIGKSQSTVKKVKTNIDISQSSISQLQSTIGKVKTKIDKSQSSIGQSQSTIGKAKVKIGKSKTKINKTQSTIGKSRDKIKR